MSNIHITLSANAAFGCRIDGIDIGQRISEASYAAIEEALHQHLVVCVSGKPFGPEELIAFGENFGELEINVAKSFHHGSYPQITVLSNQLTNGKPQGSPDAGQVWHTDMSYNRISGRATILHAHQVPILDGKALGDTAFRNMHTAYEGLPEEMKQRLESLEASHAFEKNWNQMLARGSKRGAFSDEQRKTKPPVVHPVVLRHPWTGRKALYVNRGLTEHILGLTPRESDEILNFLFDYQEEERFAFRHEWRVGDTLIWDNCATIHLASGDTPPSLPRVMIRTQVLGNEAKYRAHNGAMGGRVLNAV